MGNINSVLTDLIKRAENIDKLSVISEIDSLALLKGKIWNTKNIDTELAMWNILTALRGLDEDSVLGEKVKEYTTARIRGILGIDHFVPVINRFPLSDRDIAIRDELLKACPHHFVRHFKYAMEALARLGYDVPEKELNWEL